MTYVLCLMYYLPDAVVVGALHVILNGWGIKGMSKALNTREMLTKLVDEVLRIPGRS